MNQTPPSSEQSGKRYLAHVRLNADGSFAIHDLEEHLCQAARLVGKEACFDHWLFRLEVEVEMMGCRHDKTL